ncbi:MAG: glycosyltransferase [Planctomycetes bacterium]|nr:glycosyltransferase [Planctomycetota bacterium]
MSVVVPTFERRGFVVEAVRSVLAQTWRDLEAVVVDDGSTDGTAEAVAAIGDPRVRVVRKEHSGIAATRNRGIAEARGGFLAFLDSDDLWVPEKLEKQMALFRGDTGFVYARYRSVSDGRTLRSKPVGGPSGRIYHALLRRIFVQTSTAVVRREAAEAVGPFDESLAYADEYDFFLRLAERFPCGFVDEDLVIYRIHGGNESRREKVRVSENLEVYRRIFRREGLDRETRRIAAGRVARYAGQLARLLDAEGDREGAAAALREGIAARPLSPGLRWALWRLG